MDTRYLYLDLLKRALTDMLYDNVDPQVRIEGRDWPQRAYTMIGLKRLDNLQHCIEDILVNNIPGDLIETGIWRGGAAIFMRAVLKAYDVSDRYVWAADSFEGLPLPDIEKYPVDTGDFHHQFRDLAVSLEEVKANFQRFGLLDEHICFLKGWFRDTIPHAQIRQLAVLRLDGDMYESTMEVLQQLYPKLSTGGYVIVDDYGAVAGCRKAVDDYRAINGIQEEINWIDWTGIYWQCKRC
jgi:O-methyltransferase